MDLYHRRLPHVRQTDHPVFLTWRLHDSLPPNRVFSSATLTSGEAFAAMDRLLDEARTGPLYLSQPDIAQIVVDAIYYNADVLGHYVTHAFAIMPNHVHLLMTPEVALPTLAKSLKGITAKRANVALGLTGQPFWQEETFDRVVRDEQQFHRTRGYIEENPVRAGLAVTPAEYRWSSAYVGGRVP